MLRLLRALACKPAYHRHMLGCQPSAGTRALSREFCDGQTLRLLYIDSFITLACVHPSPYRYRFMEPVHQAVMLPWVHEAGLAGVGRGSIRQGQE